MTCRFCQSGYERTGDGMHYSELGFVGECLGMSDKAEFDEWYVTEFDRQPNPDGYESDIARRAWQAARAQQADAGAVPEGFREAVEALGPEDPMFGIDYQDEMATYHCQYCTFGMTHYGPTPREDQISHDDDCPVVVLRKLLTAPARVEGEYERMPTLEWAVRRCQALQEQGFDRVRLDVLEKTFRNAMAATHPHNTEQEGA